jgi:hypothetical protein
MSSTSSKQIKYGHRTIFMNSTSSKQINMKENNIWTYNNIWIENNIHGQDKFMPNKIVMCHYRGEKEGDESVYHR